MVKSGIKIYVRIKPTKKESGVFDIGETEDSTPTLSFFVPRSESSGYVNNKKENYVFRFDRVFGQSVKQDEVFDNVARGVVDNCLEGYNGTIFAYGQTGSGKTFTITGGAERYVDRGIIPRILSYLFQQYQKCAGTIYATHISYLEIYNHSGFDLLDPKHEATKLEDLPRVHLMEDGDGNIHLKNLSLHQASNEEEALNWLFIGDTNRMIAETPMNMASTRSHCIFTIHITSREPGSDKIRKAKLHLVDLAGSERIGKTGVGGTLLTEAKYINSSLHFLEQVIVALAEKNRSHIPYRNSMMTSVLRDSLGGNCMTSMIATCSVERKNIDETISTCRFAQRVALVKNDAMLNEELDPKLMVARLKQQVQELKDELVMATGEERTDDLTPEEKEKCKELVQGYIKDMSPEAKLMIDGDMRKIQLCFRLLKSEVMNRDTVHKETKTKVPDSDLVPAGESNAQDEFTPSVSDAELQRLRELLKQRDDEINILLKMLKQEKRRALEAEVALRDAGVGTWNRSSSPILGRTSPLQSEGGHSVPSTARKSIAESPQSSSVAAVSPLGDRDAHVRTDEGHSTMAHRGTEQLRAKLKAELSKARQEAFDSYRRNYADTSGIDHQKKILKAKYAEAKALGERVNSSRMAINKLKAKIEKHRVAVGVQGLTSDSPTQGPDSKEEEMRSQLENEKANFKDLYDQLRRLKTEIEHIQHLLEKAKMQLQRDFEDWWNQQSAKRQSPVSRSMESSSSVSRSSQRPPSSRRSKRHRTHQSIAARFPPNQDPRDLTSSLNNSSSGNTYNDRERSSLWSSNSSMSGPPPMSPHSNVSRHSTSRSSRSGSSDSTRVGLVALKSTKNQRSKESLTSSNQSSDWLPSNSAIPRASLASTTTTLNSSRSQADGGGTLFASDGRNAGNSVTLPKPLFGLERTSPVMSSLQSSIPLTGDSKADADIIAFYKARQKLLQKGTH